MKLIFQMTVTFLVFYVASGFPLNNRPIIGVVDQSVEGNHGNQGATYISANYVKYLESAGARVVPVSVNQSPEYYIKTIGQINGLLFPGGSRNLTISPLASAARIMYDIIVKLNADGDYFPVWGTCQGFQLLTNLTADENLLVATDSENISLSLRLEPDYKSSRMLGSADPEVIKTLTRDKVTPNFHHSSVLTETFRQNKRLSAFYRILSTNKDRQGKDFVSTMEAYSYPIYATQWHPEVITYGWMEDADINHSAAAIAVTQHMADFFVNEARKSNHHYPGVKWESEAIIENFKPTYKDDGSFDLVYYFNSTYDI